jgi:2-keto-4-pentenoate hydratase
MVVELVPEDEVDVPESATAAYAVQDQLTNLLPSSVVGWKIGATSSVSQERLGVKAPISGRVHQRTLLESGSTVPATDFHHRPGIECEIAFRLGRDLPAQGPAVTAESARPLVAAVHPAIELVCTRFEGGFGVAPALLVADGSAHAALVIGDAMDPEKAGDLREATCRLVVDGEQIAEGDGTEVLGDPYAALAWLCNHLRGRGIPLPSGSIVTTGTCTGIVPSGRDQHIVNDAGALGSVGINIGG